MCWRGHDPKRRNKYGYCRDCHAIRMRAYRHGHPLKHKCEFTLKVDIFRNRKRASSRIVAELAGIPFDTLEGWIFGRRHKGNPARTSRERAAALAEAVRIPFEQLWTKV